MFELFAILLLGDEGRLLFLATGEGGVESLFVGLSVDVLQLPSPAPPPALRVGSLFGIAIGLMLH